MWVLGRGGDHRIPEGPATAGRAGVMRVGRAPAILVTVFYGDDAVVLVRDAKASAFRASLPAEVAEGAEAHPALAAKPEVEGGWL